MEAGLLEKRLEPAAELVHGQRADMLGVEPDSLGIKGVFFLKVHHSIGAVDAIKSESRGEFVEREKLAIVLGRPAQQAEKVDERLRQEPCIAIGGDADHGPV